MIEPKHVLSALNYLDSECTREEWIRIGMAAKAAKLSFEDFHGWSKNAGNYKNEKDCRAVWNSFDESGTVKAATLFYLAREKGWKESDKTHTNTEINNKKNGFNQNSRTNVLEIWNRCIPAAISHEYIIRKKGNPEGLRVYPQNAPPLFICGQDVEGYLVVPCLSNGQIQTLQFIPPNENKKLNLPHASFHDGYFTVGNISNVIYIVEGLGQAWAINKSMGATTVVCFGVNRMMAVSNVLRNKHPNANLVIVSDRGKEKEAAKIAIEIAGAWIAMPSHFSDNYDVNDYLLEYGENSLRELLARPVIEMPLNVILANELPEEFTPPDELVQGILIAGDGSILYGDSNSGKTFLVIDLACSVARGVEWFGRKTEPGLVIYLAAESPASVRRRLQAYQKHHNVRVMNFAIVQSPIDLFDGDADTDALIQVIHFLEKQCRQKARLIIGDTLARLSAGANESAGQDMGLVIRHFDRIRHECNAHFMMIHHSGKNAAAGARGWSGVRAAVDTEIEVTDSSAGRCAEITKQRDLDTKGIRIGFRLDTITLGLTKWKSLATSCVVSPADAPSKNTGKRLSEVGGAISEYLRTGEKPIRKRDLVKHFESRYTSGAVYRELKKLVQAGVASDCMGYVSGINQNTELTVVEV
ncbi:MAG: AAA family ATPase [Gammaproteobacteria bacterium]